MCQLSRGHCRRQTGITQCVRTFKSDPRQSPGARAARPDVSIGGMHSGGMGGHPSGCIWKDTGGKVTIHTCVQGLHGVYISPTTTRVQSRYNKNCVALMGLNTTGPPRAALGELCCICTALQTTPTEDIRPRPLLV